MRNNAYTSSQDKNRLIAITDEEFKINCSLEIH